MLGKNGTFKRRKWLQDRRRTDRGYYVQLSSSSADLPPGQKLHTRTSSSGGDITVLTSASTFEASSPDTEAYDETEEQPMKQLTSDDAWAVGGAIPPPFPSRHRQSSLSLAVAKAHGYNNGGHEHFGRSDFDDALQFYRRALKWARTAEKHLAEEIDRRAGPAAKVDGRSDGRRRKSKRSDAGVDADNDDLSCSPSETCGEASVALLAPMTLVNIGAAHLSRNELNLSAEAYHSALSSLRSPPLCLRRSHPEVVRVGRKLSEVDRVRQSLADVSALHAHAIVAERGGRHGDALSSYTSALCMVTDSYGPIHPAAALSLQRIGALHWKRGQYDKALHALSDSFRTYVKCLGRDRPEMVETLILIGTVHSSRGDYDAALNFFKAARGLVKRGTALGEDHPDAARALVRIGRVYDEGYGQHGRAASIFRKGLAVQRAALAKVEGHCQKEELDIRYDTPFIADGKDVEGSFSPGFSSTGRPAITYGSLLLDVADTLNAMGVVDEKCGRHSSALRSYEEAMFIYCRALDSNESAGDDVDKADEVYGNHVDVAVTLNNIGQIHRQSGRLDEAMNAYRRALRMTKANLGENHRNYATTTHNMGLVHMESGEHSEAVRLMCAALKLQRKTLGDVHPDVAVTVFHLGEVYEARGDSAAKHRRHKYYAKAIKLYKKALRIRRDAFGPDHLYIGLTLQRMGAFHLEKDEDLRNAARRFRGAMAVFRACGSSDDDPHVADLQRRLNEVNTKLQRKGTNTTTTRSSSSVSSRSYASSAYSCSSSTNQIFSSSSMCFSVSTASMSGGSVAGCR